MRKLVLALAASTFMAGAAFAETDITGSVQSYDAATRVITLTDGKTVTVDPDVAVPELVAGQNVVITVDEDQANKVQRVTVAP